MSIRTLRVASHAVHLWSACVFAYAGVGAAVEVLSNAGQLRNAQLIAAFHIAWMPFAALLLGGVATTITWLARRELRHKHQSPSVNA